MTNRNPILEEIRQVRETSLANAGGTVEGLVTQLQEDERKSGRTVLNVDDLRKRRRTSGCTPAAKPGVSAVEDQSSPPVDR
jgi:hypothetical protein